MISLSRIVEQQGMEGQYYDLGKDFANFKRMIDGSFEQVKQRYEQSIGSKLIGKRVRARASRGYKQYVKDYEFDVTKVSLDDYYDNYVVVAYDNTTPKPKEYFLKPGFKITIVGPATGEPSPQKGGKPQSEETPRVTHTNSNVAQPQQMMPASAGNTPSETDPPVKESAIDNVRKDDETGDNQHYYDAYSVDDISQDIKPWLPKLLLKPATALRDFITGLGRMASGKNKKVAMFDLIIPTNVLKTKINSSIITYIFNNMLRSGVKFDLISMEYDKTNEEWHIRVKKTMTNPI